MANAGSASPKKTLQLFGAIGGLLLVGAWLRAHPSGTVGSGYHTSDRAPSIAEIKSGAFAKSLAPLQAAPAPSRVSPTATITSALAASARDGSKIEL